MTKAAKVVGAVVLAAGQSKRMGQPKLLLPWGTGTVIEQVVSTLIEAGAAEVVVVTGAEEAKIRAALARVGGEGTAQTALKFVQNPEFANSEMLVSLKVGMRALDAACDGLLMALGDQPTINTEAVRAVMETYARGEATLVVPSYQMRRGHPWLVDRSHWAFLRDMPADQTLRDFLDAHKELIEYVVVDAPEVLEDLDTPDDYRRLRGKE